MQKQVKITVVRKYFFKDLIDQFLNNPDSVEECDFFNEGDTFIFEGNAEMPKGFCPWAWIDIYHSVSSISKGATLSDWYNQEGMSIVCCSDGLRPVIFKIESIDS